jgi:hypothetical protein
VGGSARSPSCRNRRDQVRFRAAGLPGALTPGELVTGADQRVDAKDIFYDEPGLLTVQ